MAITPNSNLAGLSSKLQIGGVGGLQAKYGSTGGIAPIGVRASSPTTAIKKPATTLAPTQKATNQPAAPGSYKGVVINVSEDIPSQIAKIDAQQTPAAPAPSYPGLIGAQIKAKNESAPVAPVPKATPTYSGLVGNIASASQPTQQQQQLTTQLASAANPNNTQTGLLRSLTQAADGNTRIGQNAQSIADLYSPEIGRVGQLGAAAQAGYGSTGSNIVGAGNAAIASQNASARMSALSAAEQAQLLGNQQQLAAQGQLQSGYGTALGGANTQQAQQLSGLGAAAGNANTQQAQQLSGLNSAAGYAQPQLGSISSIVYNPLDNTQQNVLGNNVPGGLSGAASLQGGYNAALSNAQTQGTTATNIAAQGATQAVQNYNNLNAANTQFEGQASQLLTTLTQGQLNGSLPTANKIINSLGGNLGSPQVAALNAAFAETQAAYTNLLSSSGGTPTSQDQQAISALDINSTPQQIAQSIQQLQAAAKIKLGAAQNLAQGYGSSLYSGGSHSSAQGPVQQVQAADGQTYGFYQDASGKWHAQ